MPDQTWALEQLEGAERETPVCRVCGERIAWGVILRVLRVDPDTPG